MIDGSLRVIEVKRLFSEEDILDFFEGYKEDLAYIGLDGPCGVPRGLDLCCFDLRINVCLCQESSGQKGRIAERELARRGIGCFFTTKKAFAKTWIRRSLNLFRILRERGFPVLEVYPYGTKRRLFPEGLPKKATLRGRIALQEGLSSLDLKLPERLLSHHELDALLGAYTCYLYTQGLTEDIGEEEEGKIVIPVPGLKGRSKNEPLERKESPLV